MAEYVVEEPSSQSASWRVHERIVRCRDCKMCIEMGRRLYCDLNNGGFPEVEPEGYCAWGERKEVDA